MIHVYVDRSVGKIVIETDDSSVAYLLESTKRDTGYIPWKKQWGTIVTTTRLYDGRKPKADSRGVYTFRVGLGFAAYILNVFKTYMSLDDYNDVLSAIMSETYREAPFPNLRDYQNEDALHLLKYKVGLFSCYTSYGKTELIATLANYFYSIGKTVLLVAPQQKPRQELEKRIKERFGIELPTTDGRLQCMITSGLLNRKDVRDPGELKKLEAYWSSVDVLMVDEVEYTINDSGMFLYDRIIHADHFYGFSGTADKAKGEMITFVNGLDDVIIRNKDLVKYFGPSLVYRMPLTLKIDNIRVKTNALNQVKFQPDDFADGTNQYLNALTRIFTTPEVCQVIVKLGKKYPMMYLPMNNLEKIISEWVNNWFMGVFRILLICGEGYIYYDLQGNRTNLKTLEKACEYVRNGLVDIIPSTSAGFRALDLPGLETTFLAQGKAAGVVLQSVGRTARGAHMNLISLEPHPKKKIPVYSKGMENRDELIHTYYKYCDITDSEIFEVNL